MSETESSRLVEWRDEEKSLNPSSASMKAPIFIVGTGRSGTTIFFRMLKDHPHVSWLSWVANMYPDKYYLNRLLLRALDCPVFGDLLKKRVQPSEAYSFWNRVFPGFDVSCRDLLAEDVSVKVKQAFHKALYNSLAEGRGHFLAKITGWPRIGFLQEIFPNAKFIHVVRDGRAVANSVLSVPFWWGWRGPRSWRWGTLDSQHYELWERHQRSFVALAAIQWIILMQAFEDAIERAREGSALEVKYEDLCSNPIEQMRRVADFCGLDWCQPFVSRLKKHKLRNSNEKWRTELTPAQQDILHSVLSSYLERLGYR